MNYRFPECAYRHIEYRTISGIKEKIWNARDGRVPSQVSESSTGEPSFATEAVTVSDPDYVPQVGDRIIVDHTETTARVFVREMLEHAMKSGLREDIPERWPTPQDAIEFGVKEILRMGFGHVTTVSAGMIDELIELKQARAKNPRETNIQLDPNRSAQSAGIGSSHPRSTEERNSTERNERSMYYDREGRPIDQAEFLQKFQDHDYRQVARDEFREYGEDCFVSTVWLGIDHNYAFKGRPVIFESMIFGAGEDDYQERYSTEAEARIGHDKMVVVAKAHFAAGGYKAQKARMTPDRRKELLDEMEHLKRTYEEADDDDDN